MRVIAIADDRIRQRGRFAVDEGVVELDELGEHDSIERYSIEDQVMDAEVEAMMDGGETHQPCPQQRTVLELVGPTDHVGCELLGAPLCLRLGQLREIEHR